MQNWRNLERFCWHKKFRMTFFSLCAKSANPLWLSWNYSLCMNTSASLRNKCGLSGKKELLLLTWLTSFYFYFAQMSAQGGSWQKDAADQNFDYMFKLLIIGNSSVGKTSFLFRYADDSFTSAFVSTVGIDFKVKTVFRQDKRVKLQIWVSFS